jgi:hypothetical protein
MQARSRLDENKVKELIDPGLQVKYPPNCAAKVITILKYGHFYIVTMIKIQLHLL